MIKPNKHIKLFALLTWDCHYGKALCILNDFIA